METQKDASSLQRSLSAVTYWSVLTPFLSFLKMLRCRVLG
uniref:Uncharacterized protein n=1 Tax=Arundo donax TaxID=35708 RepID=A0A0A9EL08_ARUDO